MAALVADEAGNYRLEGNVTFSDLPPGTLWSASLVPVSGRVTVDLSGLNRADSVVLALLLEWERRARAAGQALCVTQVPPRLQDLMRVTGLSQVFGLS